MSEWLLGPIDPSRIHEVGPHLSWHARTMVLAWGVLVPCGVLSARYFKVFPGQNWPHTLDDRRWWHMHRLAHGMAGLLMLIGLWLILSSGSRSGSTTSFVWMHHAFGWSVVLLAASQFASGWMRGTKGGPPALKSGGSLKGDHYDMTPRRLIFEAVHKTGGLVAVALSVPAILTGLWQANAPTWMWLALGGWWLLLAALCWALEQRRGAFDTYQAIWGADETLPGNTKDPVGFGVHRQAERLGLRDNRGP
ncbi:cytochrome b561 domain-containing protein [Rhizobium sp. SL86]|uniref:cytochrome b561 domain-containing protein n=1 Tax=Rhizobium sp. SL86 TaxID=2995148 RepID=UPI0022758B23|nr:cytochrome b561 domain-containing protein [Rhizobium sp. SL86]MCY1667716.1 cytochrome b561 domain-containing protein [Rhizobium sp. SL86]